MKEIPLTQGYVALVDDEDYKRVAMHKWRALVFVRARGRKYIYAVREVSIGNNKSRGEYMHRVLCACPIGKQVDHINGDALDNRKENLRVCTQQENGMNSCAVPGSSRYKGVSLVRSSGRWQAYIMVEGKKKNLGTYSDERKAAEAYDSAARIFFGEFARPNFKE